MKLTQSNNANNAEFFRDTKKGALISKQKEEKTKYVINRLPHETSFIGRILKNPNHPKSKNRNKLFNFVASLVNETKMVDTSLIPNQNDINAFGLLLDKSLSFYGKNLKYDEDSKTLQELLLMNYEGKDVLSELNCLKKYIAKLISYKKDTLIKSIQNNDIPFEINNGKLIPSSPKMIWLFSLLGINWNNSELNKKTNDLYKGFYNDNDYEKYNSVLSKKIENLYNDFDCVYKYNELKSQLENKIESFDKEKNLKLPQTKEIYQLVLDHNHKFFEENKFLEEDKYIINKIYSFFIIEIRDHFRKHFPIKNKGESQEKRIQHTTTQKAKYYCSSEYVKREVIKRIINQLVAGLIQYGKIQYYCFGDNSISEKHEISSDTLSDIQIEEAFKKQIFLSVSWAITKLNYFYNYGSQNEQTLDTKDLEGDILTDSNYINNFKNTTDASKEKLQAKIITCFPLEVSDKIDLIELLEEILRSVGYLRNNTFHYKKDTLSGILKNAEKEYPISEVLLKRDIKSIQMHFKEQINSMNITEYYSEDLLVSLFLNNKLKFHLYAPSYTMMPSFKNIYKRGCDIYKSDRSEKGINWLIEPDSETDADGKLVYKNLLQLIYYHGFLPAINENERLITDYIKKTIDWNKKESKAGQNDKVKIYKFRYANMPEYDSAVTLKTYLEELQRQQSLKENEGIDKDKGEANYYLDFVQDIFVLAFDAYLNTILSSYKISILKPEKVKDAQGVNIPKLTLDKLFNEEKPILKMEASDSLNSTDLICLYPFLRVLDQRELNKLLHQFVRYRTSRKALNAEKEELNNLRMVEELITLVQFTIPLQKADEHYNYTINEYFKYFFENENPKDFGEMYYQSGKDKPISLRSMSMVGRSGAMALYKVVFSSQYKITNSDYIKYKEYYLRQNLQESSEKTKIETMQKELQSLHQELVKIKINEKKKTNIATLSPEQIKKVADYEALVNDIMNYEHLRHKITFESLYKLHQIHVDILARFAAFAEDWERDMFFMFTALKESDKINFDVNQVFNSGGEIIRKLGKQLKGDTEKLFFELCWSNEDYNQNEGKVQKRLFLRNSVAHLNHMTQVNKYGSSSQPNIIEMTNRLRTLLAYDAKRQNSVTKALQKILKDQYKMELIFVPEKTCSANNRYVPVKIMLKDIKICDIIHLKNLAEPVKIIANNVFMKNMIRQLLEFKY